MKRSSTRARAVGFAALCLPSHGCPVTAARAASVTPRPAALAPSPQALPQLTRLRDLSLLGLPRAFDAQLGRWDGLRQLTRLELGMSREAAAAAAAAKPAAGAERDDETDASGVARDAAAAVAAAEAALRALGGPHGGAVSRGSAWGGGAWGSPSGSEGDAPPRGGWALADARRGVEHRIQDAILYDRCVRCVLWEGRMSVVVGKGGAGR